MVNESASDDHSLTLWTQKMEFCALRLWRSVYFFLSVSPLWGGGEERDSGEKMRWCVCFLSMQIWKVNWTTREGIGSITLKISIGSTDHLSGRNCLVLSIHLYNIWHHSFATSLYICFLTSVQSCRHHSSSPKQEDPFISPCCFVISADSCCFFLFFFFSGVISTCTTLPETYGFLCSTYRRVLSHIQHSQQCTFMSAYICSHLLPLFPAVLAQCMQRDAKCAWPFPRHKSSFHTWPPPLAFLPFSQPLLTGQERKAPRTRLCFPLRC